MNRTALSVSLAALLVALSACGKQADTPMPVSAAPATTSAPAPAAAQGEVFRFRIGTLDAIALKDGEIDVANDGRTFGVGQPTEATAALLAGAGLPTDALHLSIQPLLVRSGTRVLLFDTGAGGATWARAGRLQDALRRAGVEPGQVTDVLISHAHPDHIGGLLASDGTPAFANATVHLSTPEWDALKAKADAATLVAAIGPKVATFAPGANVIADVVTAVPVEGHTPGHCAFEIASGNERMLYLGDTAHHYVVSVQRPEWTVKYDGDPVAAQASRRATLQRAADGNLRVYAVHFPFPGIGHVKREGDGFTWVPEQ